MSIPSRYFQFNSYSYLLAKHYHVSEADYVESLKPIYCQNCKISYFDNWIKDEDNIRMYTEEIPVHPTCQKIENTEEHYKESYISLLITKIESCQKCHDSANTSKHMREINSLITSVNLPRITLSEIESIKLNQHHSVISLLSLCSSGLYKTELRSGSKYGGFRFGAYRKYIDTCLSKVKFEETNATYAEAGCPIWGLLSEIGLKYKSYFITDFASNFWGYYPQVSSAHAVSKHNSELYDFIQWDKLDKVSVLNLIGFIDHAYDVKKMVVMASKKAKYLCGITEQNTSYEIMAPPVQHKYLMSQPAIHEIFKDISTYDPYIEELDDNKFCFFSVKVA